jgi:hypothetical protein
MPVNSLIAFALLLATFNSWAILRAWNVSWKRRTSSTSDSTSKTFRRLRPCHALRCCKRCERRSCILATCILISLQPEIGPRLIVITGSDVERNRRSGTRAALQNAAASVVTRSDSRKTDALTPGRSGIFLTRRTCSVGRRNRRQLSRAINSLWLIKERGGILVYHLPCQDSHFAL